MRIKHIGEFFPSPGVYPLSPMLQMEKKKKGTVKVIESFPLLPIRQILSVSLAFYTCIKLPASLIPVVLV